jgi:hypothetical protein
MVAVKKVIHPVVLNVALPMNRAKNIHHHMAFYHRFAALKAKCLASVLMTSPGNVVPLTSV